MLSFCVQLEAGSIKSVVGASGNIHDKNYKQCK